MPRTSTDDPTALERGWVGSVRRTPAGILLLAGALGVLGAGLVLGAAYLALDRPDVGWVPVVAGVGAGPLAIYAALHLVRLSHWAWQAAVIVLALLFASSVWRLVVTPPPPTVPLAEMAVEILALAYLARPRVRDAFRRR